MNCQQHRYTSCTECCTDTVSIMASGKCFQQVEGINIPLFFSAECFRSALSYKPNAGDVFIATYPKCGTTWMQYIVISILRKGKPLNQQRDFFLASPFLDQMGSEDSLRLMIRPGALKTHLPFHKVPWSDDAKYIYVARNPKDCCVSFYHHMGQLPVYQFTEGTFEEFFEIFIRGEVEFGDYFEHLIGWYEQKNKPNIFFITYEEIKNNTRSSILRVANFLGEDYLSFMEQNPKILDRIVTESDFKNMRTIVNEAMSSIYAEENRDALLADPNIPSGRKHIISYLASLPVTIKKPNIEFVRKGCVGDWVNYFTDEQREKLDRITRERTSSTDIMTLWKDI